MSMIWIIYLVVGVEIINMCLLIGLLHIYWGSYKKVRSEFTVGLVFFSSAFLIKSVVFIIGSLFFLFQGGIDHDRPAHALFLINIIECIGLALLYKITRK